MKSYKKLSSAMVVIVPAALFACGSPKPADSPAASDSKASDAAVCGPQSPRDITSTAGTNDVPVPSGDAPNLCNVHFHDPFEHAGFGAPPSTTGSPGDPVCKNVEVGDQLEFHWVYTNCELPSEPVKGLANCVCDREDLVLRVFAQAYVVDETGVAPEQPTENLVSYAGSTTGPSYDNTTCSPARVNWMVNSTVELLDKGKLGAWCESNPWIDEDHPHESRELVTDEAWLSLMAP